MTEHHKVKAMKRLAGPPLSRPRPIWTYNAVPIVPPILPSRVSRFFWTEFAKRRFYEPDKLNMSRFQFPVSIVVHTRRVHGFGAMTLGVVVVGRKVEVSSFARALLLFDVFGAAAAVACGLRGDAVVFVVRHVDGCI